MVGKLAPKEAIIHCLHVAATRTFAHAKIRAHDENEFALLRATRKCFQLAKILHIFVLVTASSSICIAYVGFLIRRSRWSRDRVSKDANRTGLPQVVTSQTGDDSSADNNGQRRRGSSILHVRHRSWRPDRQTEGRARDR